MTSAALLDVLHAVGGVRTMDGHVLRYRAPKGVMTPDLQQLAQHKAALLDLVEAFKKRAAIAEYCGGVPCAEAERLEWASVLGEPPPCCLTAGRPLQCIVVSSGVSILTGFMGFMGFMGAAGARPY